jgi:hypothetical protein
MSLIAAARMDKPPSRVMSEELPRIIGVRLAAEPRKTHITVAGSAELARMARLPDGLPEIVIALQFLSDFNNGKLDPKPVTFSARFQSTKV